MNFLDAMREWQTEPQIIIHYGDVAVSVLPTFWTNAEFDNLSLLGNIVIDYLKDINPFITEIVPGAYCLDGITHMYCEIAENNE
jgi:hypothetical protein